MIGASELRLHLLFSLTNLLKIFVEKIYDKNAITAMYVPEESNLKITCVLKYMKNCNDTTNVFKTYKLQTNHIFLPEKLILNQSKTELILDSNECYWTILSIEVPKRGH